MHGSPDEHILERLLEDNAQLADHNREHFDAHGVTAFNFMSAPGAGKTLLLAATINALRDDYGCLVIEGDMVGELDADRLRELDIPAVQIGTGRSCHLDARMVARVLHEQPLAGTDLVFIENVGNLVCPAEFPLGEHLRVVALSVTEGDDKPFKYPVIFHRCDAVVFTKCDLLPYVDFQSERARRFISAVNPEARVFELSALSGQGLSEWTGWIRERAGLNRGRPAGQRQGAGHVHLAAG